MRAIYLTGGLSPEDPHVTDFRRGYTAGMAGRHELDTTRAPWGSTANALVRARHFNMGVRAAQRMVTLGNAVTWGPNAV